MPWARLDDGFDDHPKVLAVLEHDEGVTAIGLWTLCLTWAHRNTLKRGKTPGLVPPSLPRRYLGPAGRDMAALLVRAKLWEVRAEGDGWLIHDFDMYLPSEKTSQARSEAGAKGAAARWGKSGSAMANDGSAMANDGSAMANDGSLPSGDGNLPSGDGKSDGKAVAHDGKQAENGTKGAAARGGGPSSPAGSPGDGNLPWRDGNLPSGDGKPMANDGSHAHARRVQVVTTTCTTPESRVPNAIQPATPSAAGTPRPAEPPTVTQRSKAITDAYAQAEPLCKWPAINGVVIKAIKSERFADDEIRCALLRMASEGRGVTVESLRVELAGLTPWPVTDRRQAATDHKFDRAMARAAEQDAREGR